MGQIKALVYYVNNHFIEYSDIKDAQNDRYRLCLMISHKTVLSANLILT
mgnify:CR=1 FL=1